MGACVIKNSKSYSDIRKDLLQPPDDWELFNPQHNPQIRTLKFQGILSNLRIEGDLQEPYGLDFQIPEHHVKAHFPFTQPEGNQKKTIKWKAKQQTFKFCANEYEIRTNFLQIKILNKDIQASESIKMNLYRVLTGPIKNSFSIEIGNGKSIRLMYDLKISELLKIQAKVKTAHLQFTEEFPGENFNFTLEWILSENGKNTKKVSTRPSSSICMPLQEQNALRELTENYEQPVTIDESKFKKRLSLKSIQKMGKQISWTDEKLLPEITFNLGAEEINASFFWFHCWKIKNTTHSDQKQVMFRFANFRMTVNELFQLHKQKMIKNGKLQITQVVLIKEQLWSNGIVVGHCKMQVELTVPDYIKQLHGWTRTEKGVKDAYISYQDADEEHVALQSFQKLQSLHGKLLEIKQKLIKKVQGFFAKKQIYLEGINIIAQISKQLRSIYFTVDSIQNDTKKLKQLCEKQSILLQIMNTIYGLLTENDQKLAEQCWSLLILLLKRGELQLRAIGFTEEQLNELGKTEKNINQNPIVSKKPNQKQKYERLLKKKQKIALEFQRLLFNCLTHSLTFGQTFIDENETSVQNCQIFKVYCFMRIPIFRNCVLQQITRYDDAQYSEFEIKGKEWLKSGIQIKTKQSQRLRQLEWDDYFYKALQNNPQSQELNQDLMTTLKNSSWIDQISKRGGLFFQFVKIIMQKYIQIQHLYKISKFQYFYGYKRLVAAFLNQMKILPLMHYSSTLIKSSLILLKNEDVHEPILSLIAKKTNYYDNSLVIKCLSIYRNYIHHLTQGNNLLPLPFCYGVFIKVIKQILESESANCVAATLMLIYESYDKFQSQFQSCLTLYLLGSKFNSLFYHWSYMVRSSFHHLLILKISQNQNLFNSLGTKVQKKLRQSYENVLMQLNTLHKSFCHINSKRITQKQQNKAYYLKMKYKLWKKKENKRELDRQIDNLYAKDPKIRISMDQIQINYKMLNAFKQESNELESSRVGWPLIFDSKKKEELTNLNLKKGNQDFKSLCRSQTQLEIEDQLPEIPAMKYNNKQYTYHESAKYHGAFYQHQFNLKELRSTEKNQIQIAHEEFDIINTEIRKKFVQTQQLPFLPQQTYELFDSGKLIHEEISYFTF